MSNSTRCEVSYSFSKTCSNSSAEMRSMLCPRPVGTRKKTLHNVMSSFSSNSMVSSSMERLWRVMVVLICTGSPISRAQRTALMVHSYEPGTRRKASWISAVGPSSDTARRARPHCCSRTMFSRVSSGVAPGQHEHRDLHGGDFVDQALGFGGAQFQRVARRLGAGATVHAGKIAGLGRLPNRDKSFVGKS